MHFFLLQCLLLLLSWFHPSAAIPNPHLATDLNTLRSSPGTSSLSGRSLPASPPTKRVNPQWFMLVPGWSAAIEDYLPVAPSLYAAGAIAKLYTSIITDCTNFAAQNTAPLPNGGIFHIGALEFAFEGNSPVPWEVIRGLVLTLYQLTARGFINTYTMWLTNNVQVYKFILRVGPGSPYGARGPP